jgi:hypothetical protein
MFRFSLLASLLLAAVFNCNVIDHALAQQPTQAQRDAIRSSCRSDFIANCAGVEPGGKAALECLLSNQSKLSNACQEAVNAVAAKPAEPPAAEPAAASEPPPTAAATPAAQSSSGEDQLKAVQKACTINDLMAHCSWIQPGNPEILLCLKANSGDLSPGCQSVVQSLSGAAPAAATPTPEPERHATPAKKPVEPTRKPPEPEHASAESTPRQPTSQQKSAIRAACRSDFISHCSGVQPGGAAALQCLQGHAASLSGGCRNALAAVGGGGGGNSSAPASSEAAPPPAAAAPMGPMPEISPREALGILRICGPDAREFCAGVPMGGGRIIRCLAQNASSVSPSCQAALSAAAGR